MLLNRRDFLILAVGLASGCSSTRDGSSSSIQHERMINAGSADDFASDGVYSRFLNQGFFIIRDGGKLFALSSNCTHRKCKLAAQPDRSFYCKCHGSRFDPSGKVMTGPAKRDLPAFPVAVNDKGQLLITVSTL